MATLRSLSKPAALAGALALSGLAAVPALAYPPGVDLAISCSATAVGPGATFTCTLTNTNPAGPDDITLGGLIGAGDGVSFALASVVGQDSGTYTETLTAPTTLGTYEIIGTSADETVSTQIAVVDGIARFSLIVNSDGSATVSGATPGCTVTVSVNGTAAGSGTVGSDGTVTIDAGAAPGDTVTASQAASGSCEALDATPVTVPSGGGGTTPGGGSPTTPQTGANVTLGLVAGLGALGLGGGLYAASRRKKV